VQRPMSREALSIDTVFKYTCYMVKKSHCGLQIVQNTVGSDLKIPYKIKIFIFSVFGSVLRVNKYKEGYSVFEVLAWNHEDRAFLNRYETFLFR
jgi:hypothetical protein